MTPETDGSGPDRRKSQPVVILGKLCHGSGHLDSTRARSRTSTTFSSLSLSLSLLDTDTDIDLLPTTTLSALFFIPVRNTQLQTSQFFHQVLFSSFLALFIIILLLFSLFYLYKIRLFHPRLLYWGFFCQCYVQVFSSSAEGWTRGQRRRLYSMMCEEAAGGTRYRYRNVDSFF